MDVDEDLELVEVERQELIEVLSRLLIATHPYAAHDAYMRGLTILLNIDEDEGFEAIGHLYDFADGDALVEYVAGDFGIDVSAIPHHFACTGCGQNVARLREHAYMVSRSTWETAGDPSGYYCVACLETLLARELTSDDFDWAIHMTYSDDYHRSERLLARMGKVQAEPPA